MAGWYADLGCDAFLSNPWSASGLEAIIRSFE
jgi:hypothetical protein